MPFCQVCSRELEGVEFRTISDRAVCSLSCVGLLIASNNDKCHECLRPVWKDNYYVIENDFFCSFKCKEKTRKKLIKERCHLTVKHCQDERYYNITPQKEINELRKEALEIFNELENSHSSPKGKLNISYPLQAVIDISNTKETEKKPSLLEQKKTRIVSIPKPNIITKKTKNVIFKRKIAKQAIHKNVSTGSLHNSNKKNKYMLTVFTNNVKNSSNILNKINIKISPPKKNIPKKPISSDRKHNYKNINIDSFIINDASSKRFCTTHLINSNSTNNNCLYKINNDKEKIYFNKKLNSNITNDKTFTYNNVNKTNPDFVYINGSFIYHNNSQYQDFNNNYFLEDEPWQNHKGLNSNVEQIRKNNEFENKKKNIYFNHIHKSKSVTRYNNRDNYVNNEFNYGKKTRLVKYNNNKLSNILSIDMDNKDNNSISNICDKETKNNQINTKATPKSKFSRKNINNGSCSNRNNEQDKNHCSFCNKLLQKDDIIYLNSCASKKFCSNNCRYNYSQN